MGVDGQTKNTAKGQSGKGAFPKYTPLPPLEIPKEIDTQGMTFDAFKDFYEVDYTGYLLTHRKYLIAKGVWLVSFMGVVGGSLLARSAEDINFAYTIIEVAGGAFIVSLVAALYFFFKKMKGPAKPTEKEMLEIFKKFQAENKQKREELQRQHQQEEKLHREEYEKAKAAHESLEASSQ